jgi:hypothetical protein
MHQASDADGFVKKHNNIATQFFLTEIKNIMVDVLEMV